LAIKQACAKSWHRATQADRDHGHGQDSLHPAGAVQQGRDSSIIAIALLADHTPRNDLMSEITRILEAVQQGDPKAAEDLLPLVYNDLRKLAAHKIAQEVPGQTLQATALVHEAWLRIAGSDAKAWEGRRHFFGAAAEAMRRILVEAARRKKRLKHGGNLDRAEMDAVDLPAPLPDDELLALDEALTRLAEVNPQGAEVVKLCFFVRLTQEQAAKELDVSVSTVERRWSYARAWLFRAMRQGLPPIA
jgi:RNA polymerase sigma factor (TIGR02999 family)